MIPALVAQPSRPLVSTFFSAFLALGVLSQIVVGVYAMPVPHHAIANRGSDNVDRQELLFSSARPPQATALPRSINWTPLPLQARTYTPSEAVSKALKQAGNNGHSSNRCPSQGGTSSTSSAASSTASPSSTASSSSDPSQTISCPVFATGGYKGAKGGQSSIPTTCLASTASTTHSAHTSSKDTSTSESSKAPSTRTSSKAPSTRTSSKATPTSSSSKATHTGSSKSKSWSLTSQRPSSSASHTSKGHKTCTHHPHTSTASKSHSTTSAAPTSAAASSSSSSSAPATSTSSSSSSGAHGTLWPHDGYTQDELRSDLRKIMEWAYDTEQLKGDLFEETVKAVWSAAERYWNEIPARVAARIILADIKSESDFDNTLIEDAWGMMQVTPGGDSNELELFKKHATVKSHKTSWEKGSIANSGPLTDYNSSEPLDVSKLTNQDLLRPWINIHVASWIQSNLARTGSNDPYDWQEMAQLYRTLIKSDDRSQKEAAREKLNKYLTATGLSYSFETALGSWLAGPATDGEGSYKQKGDDRSADYLNTVMDAVRMLFDKQSLTNGFLDHWRIHPGLVDYNI